MYNINKYVCVTRNDSCINERMRRYSWWVLKIWFNFSRLEKNKECSLVSFTYRHAGWKRCMYLHRYKIAVIWQRFVSNINIRKANVSLAVVYGGSWCLILTFVNFTCVNLLLMQTARRIFVGLETQSLHEAGINSRKSRFKSHIKERFMYPRFWISEVHKFIYFYTCT